MIRSRDSVGEKAGCNKEKWLLQIQDPVLIQRANHQKLNRQNLCVNLVVGRRIENQRIYCDLT